MSTLNKVLLSVVVLLILVSGGILLKNTLLSDKYYAVFTTSGDLYFGKLQKFPSLALANVYALQRNPNDVKNPFSLVKFGDAFWGPKDSMQLSQQNVLWMTELKSDSQVLQFIKTQNEPKPAVTEPAPAAK